MISVTHLNGGEFTLNAELIEYLESAQGTTVITLVTGKKIIVREARNDLVAKVLEYRREIINVKPDPVAFTTVE
jgi:flagellar protein FlbD